MGNTRQNVHELVDLLDAGQLTAVEGLLKAMVPDEDDTLSPAERKAVAEADAWSKHNRLIPNEEILAEFGLTTADWERMARETEPPSG